MAERHITKAGKEFVYCPKCHRLVGIIPIGDPPFYNHLMGLMTVHYHRGELCAGSHTQPEELESLMKEHDII